MRTETDLFGGYTQTFEPRLYYLKSRFKDQSAFPDFDTREFTPSYDLLFRDERFNGGDRISDEERLTIALTTRFIDKTSGQERFTASIAQSINYIDRRVTLSATATETELSELSRRQSPLALQMSGLINKNWRFTSDIVYDTHDDQMEKAVSACATMTARTGCLTPLIAPQGGIRESLTACLSRISARPISPPLFHWREISTWWDAGITISPTTGHWIFSPDLNITAVAGGPACVPGAGWIAEMRCCVPKRIWRYPMDYFYKYNLKVWLAPTVG